MVRLYLTRTLQVKVLDEPVIFIAVIYTFLLYVLGITIKFVLAICEYCEEYGVKYAQSTS